MRTSENSLKTNFVECYEETVRKVPKVRQTWPPGAPKWHCSARFGPYIPAKSTFGALLIPLFGQFQGRVQSSPGPIGEDFSGSCAVTSRNSLIHNGATTATKSERFDAEGVPPCCCRVLTAASERLLATLNFREFIFHALQ
jgi:hypothetical protein